MACNTIDARLEPCKEYLGGIQGIFLIPFTWSDIVTTGVNGEVTKLTASDGTTLLTGYFWELKGSSSFEDAVTSSRENGTTFHDTTLMVSFKPSAQTTPYKEFTDLNTLAQGRWRIVVWDRNDNFWLVGEEYGADATTGAESWGTALGDPRTYSVTFMAQEKMGPRPLSATSYSGLSTIFTADVTP